MPVAKVAITLERELLQRVDRLVAERGFASRSGLIQEAIRQQLQRLDRSRLARESAKLNPKFEQRVAEEGMSRELDEWPEY